MIAYVLANGAGDPQGDILRQWLCQLTHNQVVAVQQRPPRRLPSRSTWCWA